jgi:adenylylsulfate kinase
MENIFDYKTSISKKDREKIKEHKGKVLWFTGLSGSGKSTLANALEVELNKKGYHTYLLDGDNVRVGLCKDLGFSEKDRKENIRRIAEVAKLFCDAGIIVITAFISPIEKDRKMAKEIIGENNYIEIYCKCSLDECINRDVKNLYNKALKGEIKNFTGISSPYHEPTNCDIVINTEKYNIKNSVEYLLYKLILKY